MPVSVGELLAYLRLDSSGFDRGIRVAQTEMRTATGTADRMGAAVGVTGERLTSAGRAAQVAASGSAKYRAAQLSLVAAQERYNAVLAQGNASTARLATAEAAVIRANDRVATSARTASAAIAAQAVAAKESRGAFGAVRSSMSGFVGTAAKLGVGLGAFALAVKSISAIKAGVAFESDMTRLVTAAGEAKSALGDVSAGVLSISRSTGVSAKELAAAAYVIESAGYHQANGMQTVLKAAAQGAQIEGAAVKEVSNALSSLLVDYHMKATDAATVTSQLVTAVGHGKTTFAQLATALPNVAAAAAALNVTLPETAAAIATITMHGTDAAKAGTYLRQVLGQLGAGGSAKAREVMKGLGIDANELSMALTSGSGHGLLDAITMLQDGIAKHLTPAGLVAIDTFKKSAGSASDYQKMLANLPPSLTTTFGALSAMTGGVKSMQGFLQLGGQNLKTYAANTKAVASATADASGNVKEWGTASQTARVKGERLSALFNSAAITVTQKLLPPLKDAEGWLANKLPAAVHTLQAILRPFANDVAPLLSGAWHALTAVLSIAANALGIIGRAAQASSGDLGRLALVAVTMYGAFKSIGIGVAVFKAIQTAIILTRVRLLELAGTYRTLAAAEAIFGVGSLAALRSAGGLASAMSATAVAARRAAIAFSVFRFAALASVSVNADQIGVMKELVGQYKMATNSADMSAKAIIRWAAGTKAGMAGMLHFKDVLHDLGITTDQLATGVAGSDAAYKKFIATAKQHGKVTSDDKELLDKLHEAFKNTVPDAEKATTSTKHLTAAQKDNAAAAAVHAARQKQVADAEQAAADAAKRLDTALQSLSGHLGAQQALDQYRQGMQQLKGNLDKTNHSLMGNSAAAVANRLAVDNVVQSALQYADALKQQGKTQPQINSALQKQIGYLVNNATQLGLNKKELRGYLKELGLTPKQIHTAMGIDTSDARAKARAFRDYLNGLHATIALQASFKQGDPGLPGRASGGGLPEGVSAVGERGPELAIKSRSNVHILSNSQSKAYLSATGMKAPGFSGGTDPNGPPDLTGPPTSKGTTKPTYSYGGVEYSSQRAADNAAARDAASKRQDIVSGGTSAIAALRAAAHNLMSTGADLKDAAKQMRDAAAAGKVSAGTLARFTNEEHRLSRLGDRRDRLRNRLGTAPSAPTAYDRLGTAQDNYRTARSSVSASVGAFDITTAGASQYGEPVTASGILAQIKLAAAKAKRFTSLLRRLIHEGLPRPLVEQLAQAGPAAYDQAQALASSTPAQMRGIQVAYRSITSSGDAAGRLVANHYYKAGVDSAQAIVNGLLSKESALTKAIKHLAEKMVKQLRTSLDMHSPSRVLFNEARLAFSGYENGIQSKHDDIARAAGRIGGASIPGRSGRAVGDVHHHYNIDKPELHVHYPLEGDLQEGVKQLARMLPQQIRAQTQGLDQ